MVSRRDWLRGTGSLGVGTLIGCGGSDAPPDLDMGAPVFLHGVASGDPVENAVILWTRVSPPEGTGEVEGTWRIGTRPNLRSPTLEGTFRTGRAKDFTIKVDAAGLESGQTYYYRFEALGGRSLIGRTRTASTGAIERARFAVMSCASFSRGYFHAYRHVAEMADLDAVLHLGDYIYEYGSQPDHEREYDPPHETVSLDDYRRRYRQYRSDPDLQAVHQQHPFIVVWDDHESANNAWRSGAGNHDEDEGPWSDRLMAAYQAWSEYQPVRMTSEPLRIWRRLQFGELVDLIMLDTRIWGRDEQPGNGGARHEESAELLGADQAAWLQDQLGSSTARWRVLGQQVMMGHWESSLDPEDPRGANVYNLDQWDGYPAARDRVLDMLEATSNSVVLTGDIHSSWSMELTRRPRDVESYDPATGRGALGVEFVTPSVTSSGFPEVIADGIANATSELNPHIKYTNLTQRGFVVLDVTRDACQADYYLLDGIRAEEGNTQVEASWRVASGSSHLVAAEVPTTPRGSAFPLAPGAPPRDHLPLSGDAE